MEATAELVQGIIDAVESGDFARVVDYVAPDGIWRGTVGGLDERIVLHGPEAALHYFNDVADTYDEWRLEAEEVHSAGDSFVVFWRETSVTRGIELVDLTATAFTVRDGKIAEWRGYLDRGAALEAAGLA